MNEQSSINYSVPPIIHYARHEQRATIQYVPAQLPQAARSVPTMIYLYLRLSSRGSLQLPP